MNEAQPMDTSVGALGPGASNTSGPATDTSGNSMVETPLSRSFDLSADVVGTGLGDMTPSVGPRRGMASFWAGSIDASI